MTHAGHSYHESTPEGIAKVAEQERQAIVGAGERLRAAGIPRPIVSAGTTPTATLSKNFTGITEMRPLGSCVRVLPNHACITAAA